MVGIYRYTGSFDQKDFVGDGREINSHYSIAVGQNRQGETIVGYYDVNGKFMSWSRMCDPINKIGIPADYSKMSYDLRQVMEIKYYHPSDVGRPCKLPYQDKNGYPVKPHDDDRSEPDAIDRMATSE